MIHSEYSPVLITTCTPAKGAMSYDTSVFINETIHTPALISAKACSLAGSSEDFC
jgi:hypothetical protein